MGITVGGYTAHAPISAGGTAQVWRGVAEDGRPVALKVFDGAPDEALQLARRELALTAQVDHPHLVELLEVVVDGRSVVLVSELAAGGSLADLLARRGSLRPGETLTVLLPIASALATAHERGVVHGDVSPANILFDAAGRPLLADLGAAKAAVEVGAPVSATPTHVAPEVARGAATAASSDLFSLGAVALQCLTGRPAWAADDLRDVVIQSTVGQWPDPDEVAAPPVLLRVVRELLDADPARRPGAATVVLDLRRAGTPEPVDLAPELIPTGPVRPATRVRPDAVPASPAPRSRARDRIGALVGHRSSAVTSGHRAPPPRPRLRWLVTGAGVLLAIALAVQAGLWWAGWDRSEPPAMTSEAGPTVSPGRSVPGSATASGPAAPAAPSSTPPSSTTGTSSVSGTSMRVAAPDWAQLIRVLDARRAAALTARDPALLDAVYASGSTARATDVATIDTLTARGLTVAGAGHELRTARRISDDGHTVQIEVVDALPAYRVTDGSGRVVGSTPARAAQRRIIGLVKTSDGYRISTLMRG